MVYAWLPYDPENTQAFEFLGTAAHALGDKMLAIRAFSSIAEVPYFDFENITKLSPEYTRWHQVKLLSWSGRHI